MTLTYDQIRTRWATDKPFKTVSPGEYAPAFTGPASRAVLAYLLENGSATDHEMYSPCRATLLTVRKTLKDMRAAGLVQYADPSKKQTKPYGLTRDGIKLALSQEIN